MAQRKKIKRKQRKQINQSLKSMLAAESERNPLT